MTLPWKFIVAIASGSAVVACAWLIANGSASIELGVRRGSSRDSSGAAAAEVGEGINSGRDVAAAEAVVAAGLSRVPAMPPQTEAAASADLRTDPLPPELRAEFDFIREKAVAFVCAREPEAIFPHVFSLTPEKAGTFITGVKEAMKQWEGARSAYVSELTDQLDLDILANEKKLPKGEDPLAFQEAVDTGRHPTVRLKPGEHLITMSGADGFTYVIVPSGRSPLLDYLRGEDEGNRLLASARIVRLMRDL